LLSTNATVTITVTPLNDGPVALNDAYTTPEDTTLTIPAAGVLANDSDSDGDPLTAVLVSGVSHGTLNLEANGAFTYTPSINYTGVDSFVYRATDGVLSSNATVTITVTPVNDPPEPGVAGDSYTVLEDQTLTIAAPGVLANDTDVDADPLTAVLVTGVSHGTLTLNPNGSFVYTPEANYFGPDSFVYMANDGQANSTPATVNITVIPVNDAPSFTGSGDQKINQNTGAQTVSWAQNISAGPANESEQTLSFLVSNDNNGLFSAQPAIAADGTLTYAPAAGVFGVANVHVRLQDNGGTENGGVDTSSEIVFRIVVNSPPSVTIVSPFDGAGLLTPATFSVIGSAADPDGTVTNVQFIVNGAHFTNIAEAPFYFIMDDVATGFHEFLAIATDDCGLSATSAPVKIEIITNAVTAVGPIVLNRQTGLFEHFVTVSNRTTETWVNGFKLYIHDLDVTNKVWNATGTNDAGVPYIENTNAVPPGGTALVLVRYYVPNPRTTPSPRLIAIPNPFARPVIPPVIAKIERDGASTNAVHFTTQIERFYFIQYTEDFVQWKTHPEALLGNGGIKITPQAQGSGNRFYRVLMVP
jgi:VCBS repeat-containing protein